MRPEAFETVDPDHNAGVALAGVVQESCETDESTRSAIGAVIAERVDSIETTADQVRTSTPR